MRGPTDKPEKTHLPYGKPSVLILVHSPGLPPVSSADQYPSYPEQRILTLSPGQSIYGVGVRHCIALALFVRATTRTLLLIVVLPLQYIQPFPRQLLCFPS